MSIPDEAKKAVECLPAMLQYLDGHAPEDLNTLIPMQFNHATWSAIIATLESVCPVAKGESVIAEIQDILELCDDQIALAELQYPARDAYAYNAKKYAQNTNTAIKLRAMIAASQEQEGK
jgi:hypothetical protein